MGKLHSKQGEFVHLKFRWKVGAFTKSLKLKTGAFLAKMNKFLFLFLMYVSELEEFL